MAADPDIFARELLEKLLKTAAGIAGPKVARWSRALSEAIRQEVLSLTQARLHIPHYWAIYVNDGRGTVRPTRSVFLVWFRDTQQDPRFAGRTTPERKSQVRRLTKDEWRYWSRENYRAKKAGRPTPMIVARQVGPVTAKKFFDNDGGMAGFKEAAEEIVSREFSDHVRDFLGNEVLNAKASLTVRINL